MNNRAKKIISLLLPAVQTLTYLPDGEEVIYSYDAEGNILGIADQGRLGRVQSYRYDDLYRLVHSQGEMGALGLSYDSEYGYSAAGRLTKKRVSSLRLGSRGLYPVNYDNEYRYPYGSNPFAAERITDGHGNHDLKWDDDGNMTGSGDEERERRMCWTEEGRLQAYWDRQREEGVQAAYYSYDGAGERSLKLVSPRVETVQNAEQGTVSMRYATLYATPLVTINRGGYTKHYFEGGHRVCTAVGGGFGGVDWSEVEEQVPAVSGSYGRMHEMQDEGVNKAFEGCFGVGASVKGVYNLPAILEKQERWRNVAEPLHFYHCDHLGSAAYLTDRDGHVVQTLAYLPYGEDWVEQNGLGDTSRLGMYRYNGKERDGESGYLYYGARYYWSELWNGWLSVDPMVDKYPGVSPYAYCVWNPVVLVDPGGMEIWKPDSEGNLIAEQGDNATSLAEFMGISASEAEGILKSQGYSGDVKAGSRITLDNVYTRNLSKHGNLPARDRRLYYNCWGSAIAGTNGNEIDNKVGIGCPIEFDRTIENGYMGVELSGAVFGQTLIRFAEANPYQNENYGNIPSDCVVRGKPNELGTASHGAVYYGTSQDGTVYVYSKNGWYLPPQIMTLEQVSNIYGNVHGLGTDSGYYLRKKQ